MLGHVVERVPGGVAWWLAVGRFRARWGALVVRTEDSWGGGDERLPHGSVEECKRCDGSEVRWLAQRCVQRSKAEGVCCWVGGADQD